MNSYFLCRKCEKTFVYKKSKRFECFNTDAVWNNIHRYSSSSVYRYCKEFLGVTRSFVGKEKHEKSRVFKELWNISVYKRLLKMVYFCKVESTFGYTVFYRIVYKGKMGKNSVIMMLDVNG